MNRAVPFALALTVGLFAAPVPRAHAAPTTPAGLTFTEGTRVIVVGEITSQPRDIGGKGEEKMQVAIGPERTDHTLHLRNATLIGPGGQKLGADDLKDKTWVRAEGILMKDARRVEVTRLQVLGEGVDAYRQSAFFRSGWTHGYVSTFNGDLRPSTKPFAEGQSVVVVGMVSSQPRDVAGATEKKMQVAIGSDRTDYTLHMDDAFIVNDAGQKVSIDDIKDKTWIRAEGTVMNDARRVKVSRLHVIGNQAAFERSAFFRPSFGSGYLSAVAGSREIFPAVTTRFTAMPVTVVGRVSDDTGALETTRRIQIMTAGNEWTVNVPKNATVMDAKGEKISVHEIKEDQWVRVMGWQTDDLRLRALRVENIGPEAMYSTSTFFRKDYPLGYVTRGEAGRGEFASFGFSGQVTEINREAGYFVLRDETDREYRVYTDDPELRLGTDPFSFDRLKVGQDVTISGRSIEFIR